LNSAVIRPLGILGLKPNSATAKEHINSIDGKLKTTFQKIKEELNDYRDSINQNTNEIQGNYEYTCKLESKIDKLSERVDELSMFIQQLTGKKKEYEQFTVSSLTTKEQEIFLVIYMSENEINYKELARKTGLTENLVVCYVTNLITKGVLITKRYYENEVFIRVDKEFKEVQAKHNILNINESVSEAMIA
jgi:predicted transcriptional regulator